MYENQILDAGQGEGLAITPQSKEYLRETAKWAKFLAIVGFVMLGLMVIAAFSIGAIMSTLSPEMSEMGVPSGILTVFYLIFAALYFFPILYLYRFATKTQAALRTNDTPILTEALENLKSHYKFIGILMAVILGIYALFFVIALITGLAL